MTNWLAESFDSFEALKAELDTIADTVTVHVFVYREGGRNKFGLVTDGHTV